MSNQNHSAFREGTEILTDKGYVPVQELAKGDLVQTLKYDCKKIVKIEKTVATKGQILCKCSKKMFPELFADLFVSLSQNFLITEFQNNEQREKVVRLLGDTFVTDNKFKLPACLDERTEIYELIDDSFNMYSIVLENNDGHTTYGICANGLLVESHI
jgi:hypothetical protein